MQVNQIRREGQLNNIVVGGLIAAGAIAFGISCYGRQTDLVEYCFKPNNQPQFCTAKKRYLMLASEFTRILNDPLTTDERAIAQATRLRILPATNPYKWLWGLISAGLLGTAYGLSKARERKLIQYLPTYREEIKQSWLLTKLSNWQQFRQESLEVFNNDRKRQYAADLDFQLWQFGADRAARAKQISMLTPEEIAIYTEQSRLQAQIEAQIQQSQVTGQPQAALPGMSLDEVNDPSDKLTAQENVPDSPGLNILDGIVTTRRSTLFIGDTGSGKSVTQAYILTKFFE
ncbi:MAG: hypothetical protein U7123_08455, partial [Potamolinea sp.]